MVDLAPERLFLRQRKPQFEFAHHVLGQHLEHAALVRRERARLVIEHAQRPQRQPLFGAQHRAGVEPETGLFGAQRVVGHALVFQRVGDLDEIAFEDHMPA